MKVIFYIFCFIALALWIGDFRITFHPFSIRLQSWEAILAWILIVSGVIILAYGLHKRSYNSGYNDAMKDAIEILQEKEN
jgi:hypothetical protein